MTEPTLTAAERRRLAREMHEIRLALDENRAILRALLRSLTNKAKTASRRNAR